MNESLTHFFLQVPAPAPAPKPISVPDVKAPEFKAPDIKLDIPDFKSPDIKLDIPEFKAPDIKIPSFSMPKVDLPEMPKTSGAPAMSAPKFDIPKAPSISMPKLDIRTEVDEDVEPQEVRDDRAKEARSVYKEADDRAKVRPADFNSNHSISDLSFPHSKP